MAHLGQILKNLARLARLSPERLLPRIPLIPGINDDEENLRALARLLVERGLSRVVLLAYNPLWLPKRQELGLEPSTYANDQFMTPDQIARCEQVMRAEGLDCDDGADI